MPQGKNPWLPLDRKLGGPQSQFRNGGEEKNPSTCWESNSGSPACSLVTILKLRRSMKSNMNTVYFMHAHFVLHIQTQFTVTLYFAS
jgi:hypothetical protein